MPDAGSLMSQIRDDAVGDYNSDGDRRRRNLV